MATKLLRIGVLATIVLVVLAAVQLLQLTPVREAIYDSALTGGGLLAGADTALAHMSPVAARSTK